MLYICIMIIDKIKKHIYNFWGIEDNSSDFKQISNNFEPDLMHYELLSWLKITPKKSYLNNFYLNEELDHQIEDLEEEEPIYDSEELTTVLTKKEELIQSLAYMKNKTSKTKKDKESIYCLEMIIKNM